MFDNAETFNSLIPSEDKEAINYINSISIDEFRDLINKPDFFISIADRLMFLNYITRYIEDIDIEKLKLVMDNIMANDSSIILSNNIMSKRFLKWIKRDKVSFLLNYFLEIIPKEHINNILDNLFLDDLISTDFDFNRLVFNDNNKNIISTYINECNEDKLKNIFRVIYNSANVESKWAEFIFEILIKEDKLNLFLEYYKGLIDKSDEYSSTQAKERLISLLISLINSINKDNEDENNLQEFVNNLFYELSKDDSKDSSEKILTSTSKKLVTYMNDLVGSFLKDASNVVSKILKSPILIKYINPKNSIRFGRRILFRKSEDFYNGIISYDEIRKIFFDDELNINLIKNLNSSTLIEFFCFNGIDYENTNDRMFNILKELLRRYFPYEKAIFFIDEIKINDIKKKEIITEIYQDVQIEDIKNEKEKLINKCKDELLSPRDEVSDLFKTLLPELIEIPYDDELFNKLKNESLKINKLEYLFVYLSLYFKKGCNDKNMDYKEYILNFIPKYCRIGGTATSDRVIINYKDYSEDATINIWNNVNYVETTNHERTHLWQDTMSDVISMDALMIGLEKNLIFDSEYYNSNYYNVYMEVHARIVSFYETFKYLCEIEPYIAYQYLESNIYIYEESQELLNKKKEERTNLWNKIVNSGEASTEEEQEKLLALSQELKELEQEITEIVDFNRDRKKAKSIEYFANLINTFLERTPKEEIIDLRKIFKTLELITDNDGRFYNVNEIEERMNSIKSYSTNDIEFNAKDRDTKLFYIKYLHNLRYCLNNNLINFDKNIKGKNND